MKSQMHCKHKQKNNIKNCGVSFLKKKILGEIGKKNHAQKEKNRINSFCEK